MTEGASEGAVASPAGQNTGLVLGAGGLVGLAYHAGVLRALERVGGVVPGEVDLIVGSSAGSVIGAYLRSGTPIEEFWQLILGSRLQTPRQVWDPMFRSPFDFGRRML